MIETQDCKMYSLINQSTTTELRIDKEKESFLCGKENDLSLEMSTTVPLDLAADASLLFDKLT